MSIQRKLIIWIGIFVLLVFMIAMNAAAVILRRRFERRW